MKKLIVSVVAFCLLLSCQKDISSTAPLDTATASNASVFKNASQQLQPLIAQWTEWIYGNPVSTSPIYDPSGAWQDLNQPNGSGVFLLAGGGTGDPYNRTITISKSRYQSMLVPLVTLAAWYDLCHPGFEPRKNQSPENFFKKLMNDVFNGNKNELTLTLDGKSLLSTNQTGERANSGVIQFGIDPSWDGGCSSPTTFYTDGFWYLLDLITLAIGEHELVIGGNGTIKEFDFAFSNIVHYTINVVP